MRIIPKSILPLALVTGLLLGACSSRAAKDQVVTTVYPVEFLTARIADGTLPVKNLVAAGAEPHDLELSPRQVDEILDALLVVNLGNGFQPAVDDAVANRQGPTVEVLNALPINAQGRTVEESHDEHSGEQHSEEKSAGGAGAEKPDDGHGHEDEAKATEVVAQASGTTDLTQADTPLDPHVWLDPVLMRNMVTVIGDALIAAEPDQADSYRTRMTALDTELAALDTEFRTGLATCQRRTIVTAHEAFGWLAQRYNLTQYGIAGIEPDAEPSAARLAELADLAKDQGITTIFTEELVSPKVAETVAREAGGLKVETLSPLESLSEEQVEAGDDYFSVMRANLAKLRAALSCS